MFQGFKGVFPQSTLYFLHGIKSLTYIQNSLADC